MFCSFLQHQGHLDNLSPFVTSKEKCPYQRLLSLHALKTNNQTKATYLVFSHSVLLMGRYILKMLTKFAFSVALTSSGCEVSHFPQLSSVL